MFSGVKLTQGHFAQYRDAETGMDHTVNKFIWTNNRRTTIEVINYGATITRILLPDKNNSIADVAMGFDDLDGYRKHAYPCFGATLGRVANRIADSRFKIGSLMVEVDRNDGRNSLHGGFKGFNKQFWKPYVDGDTLILTHLSKHGEQGFPGDLLSTITMKLTTDNEFIVLMQAMTTQCTPVNFTNHSYFNMAGHDAGEVELRKHLVSINASEVTETTDENVTTGVIIDITNTAHDFQVPTLLGKQLDLHPRGFDKNFCIRRLPQEKSECHFVASATHPPSGRTLEVYSNQPGMQFYTSNGLPPLDGPEVKDTHVDSCDPTEVKRQANADKVLGKQNKPYNKFGGLCFETQKYPNAVNIPHFPSFMLAPGEVYRHVYVYKFGIQE